MTATKNPADYPFRATRLERGRTLHHVRDTTNGDGSGWLEAACGKSGRLGTSYGFRLKPTRCTACRRALGLPTT